MYKMGIGNTIYFPVVMGTSSIGESGALDNNAIGIFVNLKKVTIFNYPLVSAMMGNNAIVNILIYFEFLPCFYIKIDFC